jgi:hypothetical protein
MSEASLSDTQRMWLRASAYDAYDMLVMVGQITDNTGFPAKQAKLFYPIKSY